MAVNCVFVRRFHCRNDTPLISERAALRGRSVTEGGEPSDVKSAAMRASSSLVNRIERREHRRAGRPLDQLNRGHSPTFRTGTPAANDATSDAHARR
jgi:hypothetical protein